MENERSAQVIEYDAFKDFTRRILAVPKSEVDQAEKKLPPLKRGRKKSEKREPFTSIRAFLFAT